jgi:hypothetical protein
MVNLKIVDPRDPASARYGISNFLWFEGIMNYRASLSNQIKDLGLGILSR